MTNKTGEYPDFLHYESGDHRSAPASTSGVDLDRFKRKMREHLENHPPEYITLDAEHLPEIGATITAYDTPWHTVTGEVIAHQPEKGLGLVQENRGQIEIKCSAAERHNDQQFIGLRLGLYYGTRYTLHNA